MKKPSDEKALLEMLEMEKLALETHKLLGNERGCLMSKIRIADIKIMRLVLSGDLPLETLEVL